MAVLTIGQATKAFMNEHIEWHRQDAKDWGYPFHEASKRGELMEIAVTLSVYELWQVERVASALLPVTSAIAAAMLIDNQ